jgi:two-component system chemotaxis response regulator CheB
MMAPESGGRDIIVIGASAGGVEAIREITARLPADLPAAVFIVLHSSPHSRSLLASLLHRAGPLDAFTAEDGAPVLHGRIHVAPPGQHLLLRPGHVHLSRGPRENSARPAVNPLFRTAAASYGDRVIGVVLTGNLDDGTAGLLAISDAGGLTVVQDPEDAMYPGMPRSAVENVRVDHVVPLAEIPALLERLVREPRTNTALPRAPHVPPEHGEDGMRWLGSYAQPGRAAGLSCPECDGPLWEVRDSELLEFGCLIGHRFSPETLAQASATALEETLSVSLRALEERVRMAERLAENARERGQNPILADRRLREAERARRIAAQMRGLMEMSHTTEADAAD